MSPVATEDIQNFPMTRRIEILTGFLVDSTLADANAGMRAAQLVGECCSLTSNPSCLTFSSITGLFAVATGDGMKRSMNC